jgi:RimJ/RimL family protein N-acetyltransferase
MNATLRAADAETRRFGLNVLRANLAADERFDGLLDALLEARADVAIVRLAADPCAAAALPGMESVPSVLADGLSTWAFALERVEAPAHFVDDVALARAATPADGPAIDALVARVFADHPSHYRANPLFAADGTVAGYAEWARAHVGRADRTCWVQTSGGEIVALACASHDGATGVASGNLHGIDPRHAGRGLYTRLIQATLRHYAALGLREFRIATQSTNFAVQRVWTRLGLRPVGSEVTVHLMPLFGRALDAPLCDPQAGAAIDAGMLAAHRAAFGESATCEVRLFVRGTPGGARVAGHRSVAVERHDGARACTTLAQCVDGHVAGWAMSPRVS